MTNAFLPEAPWKLSRGPIRLRISQPGKFAGPRTTKSAVRIKSIPGARQSDYSSVQVFEHLWRYWDRSDLFPHGVNMMFRREAFRGVAQPLFLPTCPDYISGARLA